MNDIDIGEIPQIFTLGGFRDLDLARISHQYVR